MSRIIDLKILRTGEILGKTKSGKSVYIAWWGAPEPELLLVRRIKRAIFMGDKRYLVK